MKRRSIPTLPNNRRGAYPMLLNSLLKCILVWNIVSYCFAVKETLVFFILNAIIFVLRFQFSFVYFIQREEGFWYSTSYPCIP